VIEKGEGRRERLGNKKFKKGIERVRRLEAGAGEKEKKNREWTPE